jgi:hypothetical protein
MGIKKSFIEMIKSGYPDFDPQNDTVEIEFEGGGDSFGSFSYIGIYPNREGSLDLNDHWNFLFQILDESGVEYNWNNAGTSGKIEYNMNSEEEITVSTIVSEEYWGEIYEEDEEEMKIWDTTVGDGLDGETNHTIYWDGTVEGSPIESEQKSIDESNTDTNG